MIAVLNLIAIHLGDLVTATKEANRLGLRMVLVAEGRQRVLDPRPLTKLEACVQGKCQCKPGKRRAPK